MQKNHQKKGDGNILGNATVTEGTFILPPHKVLPWKDNTREYKKRFASPNEKLFAEPNSILRQAAC